MILNESLLYTDDEQMILILKHYNIIRGLSETAKFLIPRTILGTF